MGKRTTKAVRPQPSAVRRTADTAALARRAEQNDPLTTGRRTRGARPESATGEPSGKIGRAARATEGNRAPVGGDSAGSAAVQSSDFRSPDERGAGPAHADVARPDTRPGTCAAAQPLTPFVDTGSSSNVNPNTGGPSHDVTTTDREATEAAASAASSNAALAPLPLTMPRISLDRRMFFIRDVIAWMNDEANRKLGIKSRRIGLTYGHAYDRTSRRVRGLQRKAYYTGISLDMAREYIDYCAFHAKRLSVVSTIIPGECVARYRSADGKVRKVKVNTFTIEFPAGGSIIALPSRPAAMRGRDGDMDADEWPFHENQAELYKAAVSVTKWGGQFAGWGSHNGDGTLVWAIERGMRKVLAALGVMELDGHPDIPLDILVAKARELHFRPAMSIHRITIVRAVASGLVELLNRVTGANYTRESFLAECHDECLNGEHYQQEYMCVPTTAQAAALKYHTIEACQHEDCPAPLDGLERLDEAVATLRRCYTGGPGYGGMDIGSTQDPSVLWLWEGVGDVLWTRLILRLRDCRMPDQEYAVERLAAVVRLVRCAILKRGVGVGILEHLVRRLGEGRIVGIDETNPVKVGLAAGIIQAFEDRRVRVPVDDSVKEGLHAVRETRTPGNLVSYDAPRGTQGHGDEFWAAAAGLDCATLSSGGLTIASAADLHALAGGIGSELPEPELDGVW